MCKATPLMQTESPVPSSSYQSPESAGPALSLTLLRITPRHFPHKRYHKYWYQNLWYLAAEVGRHHEYLPTKFMECLPRRTSRRRSRPWSCPSPPMPPRPWSASLATSPPKRSRRRGRSSSRVARGLGSCTADRCGPKCAVVESHPSEGVTSCGTMVGLDQLIDIILKPTGSPTSKPTPQPAVFDTQASRPDGRGALGGLLREPWGTWPKTWTLSAGGR